MSENYQFVETQKEEAPQPRERIVFTEEVENILSQIPDCGGDKEAQELARTIPLDVLKQIAKGLHCAIYRYEPSEDEGWDSDSPKPGQGWYIVQFGMFGCWGHTEDSDPVDSEQEAFAMLAYNHWFYEDGEFDFTPPTYQIESGGGVYFSK